LEATYSNKQLKFSNSSTESFSQNFQHFMNNKRVALVSNTSGAHQRKNKVHTSRATVSTSRPQNAAADRYKALRDKQSAAVTAYTRDISIQGQALDAQLSANQLLSKSVSNSNMRFGRKTGKQMLISVPHQKAEFEANTMKPSKVGNKGVTGPKLFRLAKTSNNLKSKGLDTLPPTVVDNDVVMAKKFKKEEIAEILVRRGKLPNLAAAKALNKTSKKR
jgi:thiazole synthase ThiGH ThiG subunit